MKVTEQLTESGYIDCRNRGTWIYSARNGDNQRVFCVLAFNANGSDRAAFFDFMRGRDFSEFRLYDNETCSGSYIMELIDFQDAVEFRSWILSYCAQNRHVTLDP